MPNCVLYSQLSVSLISGLDESTITTCSKTRRKEGGRARQSARTKLGAEQQNTVSVVYGCRLGTNSGFSVKLSHSSQASDWVLNTAFVLSHHQ